MIDAPAARPGRIYGLVALLAIVVFLNSLRNGLVYDSSFMIGSNATFREIAQEETVGAKIAGLSRLFDEGFWDGVNRAVDPSRRILGQALYRPLMMCALGVSYVFFGMTATPVIVLSLLWHVLTALLVVRLGFRLSGSTRVAGIAGLLFAVHPLHTEAVAYAVGVGETQATFFALVALVLYGNAWKNDSVKVGRYLLAVLCYAIALFTKESAATLLVLLPLFDLARRGEAPKVSARLLAYAGFAAVIAVNIAIRYAVIGRLTPNAEMITELDNPLIREGFLVRLATGVTLFARAIHLFVLPIGQSTDYSFNELPIARGLLEPASLSAFVLLAVMTIGAWKTLRSRPALGFGLFFFLFGFGALSNIPVAHGTIFAERILYLPTVGLALAAGVMLSQLLGWLEKRSDAAVRATRAILVSLLVVFAILCAVRNRVYATQDALCTDMVKTAPNSARAHYMFGENERRKRVEEKAGDIARAISAYQRAIEIWPNFLQAHLQLGFAFAAQNEHQRAIQKLQTLKNALPKNESTREMVKQIDAGLEMIKRTALQQASPEERERAIQQFISDLEDRHRADPDDIGITCDLISIYNEFERVDDAWATLNSALLTAPDDPRLKAVALPLLTKRGEIDRAKRFIDELQTADHPEARSAGLLYRLIDTYKLAEDAGRKADAENFEKYLTEAESLANRYFTDGGNRAAGYYYRALIHKQRNRLDAALEDLKQALMTEPSATYVYEEISRLFVAMRKFDEQALTFYTLLEKDQPANFANNGEFQLGFARLLDGLGRLDEAITRVEKAISIGFNGSHPHSMLGAMLIKAGRYEEAAGRLAKAEQDLKLDFPDVIQTIGNALFELKRFDEAEQVYRRALTRAEALARTDAKWQMYAMLWLPFHLGKSQLRIPAKETEGFDRLEANRALIEPVLAAIPTDHPERPVYVNQFGYTLRQLAWGYANSTTRKDVKKAIELLERAFATCLEAKAMEAAHDVGGDLIELLEANGQAARAAEIRGKMQ